LEANGSRNRKRAMLSSSKQWWPGTELNRRRQPFQNATF